MRDMGVHGLLINCSDYKCSHLITMSGDQWLDEVRLSDINCGKRGVDVRPDRHDLLAARGGLGGHSQPSTILSLPPDRTEPKRSGRRPSSMVVTATNVHAVNSLHRYNSSKSTMSTTASRGTTPKAGCG